MEPQSAKWALFSLHACAPSPRNVIPARSRSERTQNLDVQDAVLHKLGVPGSRLAARRG